MAPLPLPCRLRLQKGRLTPAAKPVWSSKSPPSAQLNLGRQRTPGMARSSAPNRMGIEKSVSLLSPTFELVKQSIAPT